MMTEIKWRNIMS